MIVAFKNKQSKPDLTNKLIGFWTKSEWVHVEMLLTDPHIAVTSRPADSGVWAKNWDSILANDNLWEFYEVPVTSDRDVWKFLMEQTDKSFNYLGLVAGQVLGSSMNRTDAWFCSELTYSVLLQYGQITLPQRQPSFVSPALLRQYLIDAGCTQVSINQLKIM